MSYIVRTWTIVTLFCTFCLRAGASDAEFSAAAQLLSNKEYEKAISSFQDLLKSTPANPKIHYNLGLAEFQLGKKGAAIGHFYQALEISPDLSLAREALRYAQSKLDIKELPHEVSILELLHNNILIHVRIETLHVLTLFFLFGGILLLIRYLKNKQEALKQERAPPPYTAVAVTIQLLAAILIVLTSLKIFDNQVERAVILDAKVSALASPTEGAPIIFELYEGLMVSIDQVSGDWAQVSYPGGSSGWVGKKSLFQIKDY